MDTFIAVFIAGVGAGLAIHRLIMILVIDKINPTACDFCQWKVRKEELALRDNPPK